MLPTNRWLLAIGYRLLAVACRPPFAGRCPMVAGCWLLAASCCLVATTYWLLAASCLLAVACCLMAAGRCLVATACQLLLLLFAMSGLLAAGCWLLVLHGPG